MKLVVVGCSGSTPGPESAASSYLVSATEGGRTTTVLLDLGSGAFGPLQKMVDPREVDAIILTHLHPDHCLDMCAWDVAASHSTTAPWAPVDVYAPAGAAERIARAADVGEPDPDALASSFTFHDLGETSPGAPLRIGCLEITTARMDHPVETYAIRLEERGTASRGEASEASMVYSADTGPCEGLVELSRGAHLLLAEAAFPHRDDLPTGLHLSGTQAGQAAARAGVGTLVLTHVPAWESADARATEAEAEFDGTIIVARPGLTLRSSE